MKVLHEIAWLLNMFMKKIWARENQGKKERKTKPILPKYPNWETHQKYPPF